MHIRVTSVAVLRQYNCFSSCEIKLPLSAAILEPKSRMVTEISEVQNDKKHKFFPIKHMFALSGRIFIIRRSVYCVICAFSEKKCY